jgi:hypothetical protein
LRERHRKVSEKIASTFAAASAQNGKSRLLRTSIEPTQLQLTAQCPETFAFGAKWLVGSNYLLAERLNTTRLYVRIVELQRQSIQNVAFREKTQLDSCVSEAQFSPALVLQYALRVAG